MDFILWRDYVIKIVVAFLLALPVAWDRERHTRIMGLRTFPLVAMGTCAFILVAEAFIPADAPDAKARIMQGLLGGIGFIGGGAILKDKDRVLGTASAASIWIMGALGAAVAYGNLEVAITLAIADLLVLAGLRQFKKRVDTNSEHNEEET
ncbi:MAG: MgtC/SapB family protein [Gammaproteobacteria bacterium]|nr:MgtC/SapB family protein [Gammaproteobacteria bacterium]